MKTTALALLIISASVGKVLSQAYTVDEVSKTELSKLEFMTGKWKGSGWMMGRDGNKFEFEQKEDLSFKLEGTAMLVEGHGVSMGNTVHRALAVIRWDKEKG